jgi:glycosyltransferase involved in cell wall biosynthesis
MKNLLIITREVNVEDDLLGFFVEWIREFAKHFDRVFVIALAKGNYQLPGNVSVYSLGKEKGNSKIAMAFNFYKYLFRLAPKSSGIFAHTSATYVIASWPATLIFRKKIILWYLHRSINIKLKIAEKLCYKIVTAVKESLVGFESKKIIETGHGINVEEFKTERNWTDNVVKILSVGRISKIKDYETLLRAVKVLKDKGINLSVEIVGRPIMPPDFLYFEFLKSLKEEFGLGDVVRFVGFVPHNKIADYYKKSDIVVGMTPRGGIDKSLLEAMASGALILTSNEEMGRYLGEYNKELIFDYGKPANLAEKLIRVINWSSLQKNEASNFLLDSVKKFHNLKNLIEKIIKLY